MHALDVLLRFALVSALVAWLATPGGGWLPRRLRRSDGGTPALGGVSVALGALCGILRLPQVPGGSEMPLWPMLVGALIAFIAGFVSDLRAPGPSTGFAWQITAAAAAALVLVGGGVRLEFFLVPVPVLLAATVLWVCVATVAFAVLPERLCAGLGAVTGCCLAAVNFDSGEVNVAAASAAVGGSCAGFLPHAWPNARSGLGSGGRALIGFSLAALSVVGVYTRWAPLPGIALLVPPLLFAVPLVDLLLAAVLRYRAGLPLWRGDRGHIGQRLAAGGRDSAAATCMVWLVALACGLIGFLLRKASASRAFLLIGAATLILASLATITAKGRWTRRS